MEPIWEADLEPNAYGYRPRKSAQDALQKVDELLHVGYTDVVDADLSKYFDTIPQFRADAVCGSENRRPAEVASDQEVVEAGAI
ncbi:MAG TPA: hypothetical protein VN648_24655 [Candidatus Methylomirabilis sp.]|nr:hypothetical protein [Candidatus Methylomirabilis sp.]